MKTLLSKNKHRGFTLIELLIVIALLGALAIGLLATIDPFEQLKKGRDTSMRNTVSEYYNALLRYYSVKGQFPWGQGTTFTARAVFHPTATDLETATQELTEAGELKQRFQELAGTGNLENILVTSTDDTHVAVCFDPESKAFNEDLNTVYNSDASDFTDYCQAFSGTGDTGDDCYYCIQ